MTNKTTRDNIIEAADRLFYQHGFEHTSFTDIAGAVTISRGNFYHHFKTKDEILDAVIDSRLRDKRMMLERWEIEGDTPTDRIKSFIDILTVNQSKIMQYGCPIGTLCTELAKLNHSSQKSATKLFTLFRTWLVRQFTLMGCEEDAEALAMHLLARSQGVATLANAFHDQNFVREEVQRMYDWLQSVSRTTTTIQGSGSGAAAAGRSSR